MTVYDETFYEAKLKQWENSLLDFSMRNRLLNLKTGTRSGALSISEPGMDVLWEQLALSGGGMRFPNRTRHDFLDEEQKYEEYLARFEAGTLGPSDRAAQRPAPFVLGENELIADIPAADMKKRLKSIRQRAKLLREERGVDTLYLAFGTVRWTDPSHKERLAPLVLLPVSVSAPSKRSDIAIAPSGEDPAGNLTFRVYTKQKFGLEIPEYIFEEGTSLDAYLDRVESSVEEMGWQVEHTTTLGVFSFAQITMYQDLVDNGDKVVAHPVVRAICGDDEKLRLQESSLDPRETIVRNVRDADPSQSFQVLDADSSQELAIQMANAGYSFVLQGPPGTGKSQTIANIISEALANGKTVLFVSEKRAALDVVYHRLEQVGLDDFVFVLHDVKQNKKEAIKDLADQLNLFGGMPKRTNGQEIERYRHDRDELDAYEHEMHEVIQPFGKSMWDAYDELVRLGDEDAPIVRFKLDGIDICELSGSDFYRMRDNVAGLGRALDGLGMPATEHPWRGLRPRSKTEDFAYGLKASAAAYRSVIDAFCDAMDEASSACGVQLEQGTDAAHGLCDLLQEFEGTELELKLLSLDDAELDRLERSLKRLAEKRGPYVQQIVEFNRAYAQSGEFVSSISSSSELEELIATVDESLRSDEAFSRWNKVPQERISKEMDELERELGDIASARAAVLADYRNEIFELDARSLLMEFEGADGKFSSSLKRSIANRREYHDTCNLIEGYRRSFSGEKPDYDKLCTLLHQLDDIAAAIDRLEEEGRRWQSDFPGLFHGARTDIAEVRARYREYQGLKSISRSAPNLLRAMRSMESDLSVVAQTLGKSSAGITTDFEGLLREVERVRPLHRDAQVCGADALTVSGLEHSTRAQLIDHLGQALEQLERTAPSFRDLFEPDALPPESDLSEIRPRLDTCIENSSGIDAALAYSRARARCCEAGLEDFVKRAEAEALPGNKLLPAFERRVYVLWLESVRRQRPAVSGFDTAKFQRERDAFKYCDSKYVNDAGARTRTKLLTGLREARSMPDAGLLQREANKKRNVKPLRMVFAQMPDLACKLKPCMMMSPLSVSTFLETRPITFDLVVFDEASQVTTEDAVGAISRGKQAIIAGDSHQLPPTSFFSASNAPDDAKDDERYEEEGAGAFESVLEEAGQLKTVTLRWHYRSRNESLIAFSNNEIYSRKLITFPSSYEQREGEGVSFEYVDDGVWQGARAGNPVEARRAAELVLDHFERYPERSLGVIAFSNRQAELIEEEIEALREEREKRGDSNLETCFDENAPEPFFVKNLENVQGDERDSIILSVGYGRDATGKVMQRFGPMNIKGGERRLNVAVTRAKHDLTLVSSMRETDVTLSSSTSRGPELLRGYLGYAQRCEAAKHVGKTSEASNRSMQQPGPTSHVLALVERELGARGYFAERSIGESSCKIDLGVKRAAEDDEYIAGIVLDGPEPRNITARERERIQPDMLQQTGWNLYHVRVQEWQRHLGESLDRLLDEIDRCAREAEEAARARASELAAETAAEDETEAAEAEWARASEEAATTAAYTAAEEEAAWDEPGEETSPAWSSPLYRSIAENLTGEEPATPAARAADEANAGSVPSEPYCEPESVAVEPHRKYATDRDNREALEGTSAYLIATDRANREAVEDTDAPFIAPEPSPANGYPAKGAANLAGSARPTALGDSRERQGLPRNLGEPDSNGFYPYLEVDPDQFDDPVEFAREVIRSECPVSRAFLECRVRKGFYPKRGRTGNLERDVVDRACAGPEMMGFEERTHIYEGKAERFFYSRQGSIVPRYRGDSSRDFDEIPPEELEEGICRILRWKKSTTKKWVANHTLYAFGYRNLTDASKKRISAAIASLADKGRVSTAGNNISLCEVPTAKTTPKNAPAGEGARAEATAGASTTDAPAKESAQTKAERKEQARKAARDAELRSRERERAKREKGHPGQERAGSQAGQAKTRGTGDCVPAAKWAPDEHKPRRFSAVPLEKVELCMLQILERDGQSESAVGFRREAYRELGYGKSPDDSSKAHLRKAFRYLEENGYIRVIGERVFQRPSAPDFPLDSTGDDKDTSTRTAEAREDTGMETDSKPMTTFVANIGEKLAPTGAEGESAVAATIETATDQAKPSTTGIPADNDIPAASTSNEKPAASSATDSGFDGPSRHPRNLGEPDSNGFYPYLEVDPDQFDDPVEFAQEVIRSECPVSRTSLERRVKEEFFPELWRTGNPERSVVDRAIRGLEEDFEESGCVRDGKHERFFYSRSKGSIVPRYRGDSSRDFAEISPEELEAGVCQILIKKGRSARKQLLEQTFYAFGYFSLTDASEKRINAAIDSLLSKGKVGNVKNGATSNRSSGARATAPSLSVPETTSERNSSAYEEAETRGKDEGKTRAKATAEATTAGAPAKKRAPTEAEGKEQTCIADRDAEPRSCERERAERKEENAGGAVADEEADGGWSDSDASQPAPMETANDSRPDSDASQPAPAESDNDDQLAPEGSNHVVADSSTEPESDGLPASEASQPIPAEPAGDGQPASGHAFRAYRMVDTERGYGSLEEFFLETVRQEAPVHINIICRRAARYMHSATVSKKVTSAVRQSIKATANRGGYRLNGKFFYLTGEASAIPRQMGDRRWNEIAPEELEAGLLQVLQWEWEASGRGIPRYELVGLTNFEFSGQGIQKLNRLNQSLSDALNRLIEDGDVQTLGDPEQTTLRAGDYAAAHQQAAGADDAAGTSDQADAPAAGNPGDGDGPATQETEDDKAAKPDLGENRTSKAVESDGPSDGDGSENAAQADGGAEAAATPTRSETRTTSSPRLRSPMRCWLSIPGSSTVADAFYYPSSAHTVVLSGSSVSRYADQTVPSENGILRQRLLASGDLCAYDGNTCILQKNLTFDSTTEAAEFVLGTSASGPDEWCVASGVTLGQIFPELYSE